MDGMGYPISWMWPGARHGETEEKTKSDTYRENNHPPDVIPEASGLEQNISNIATAPI